MFINNIYHNSIMYWILLIIIIIIIFFIYQSKLEHFTFPNHGIYNGLMGPAVPRDRWLRDPNLRNAVISPLDKLAILSREKPNDLNNCWSAECPPELMKYGFNCWRCS